MCTPIVSVIIPVFNAEKSLNLCISSILSQTLKNFELLLIDDGSTDSSYTICRRYELKDNRVKVLHKENSGVSSARNLGIEKAKGTYLFFCDADDYCDNQILEKLSAYSEDLIIGGVQYYGLQNDSIIYDNICYEYDKIGECLQKHLMDDLLRTPWGKLFKSEIIHQNNLYYDINMHIGEDTYFVHNYLFYCKNIRFINHSGYFYYSKFTWKKYKLNSEQYLYNLNNLKMAYLALADKFQFKNEDYLCFANRYQFSLYVNFLSSQHSWRYYKDWIENTLQFDLCFCKAKALKKTDLMTVVLGLLDLKLYTLCFFFIIYFYSALNYMKKAILSLIKK